MPQREFIPRNYQLVDDNGLAPDSLGLKLMSKDRDAQFQFTFQALRPGLFHTTFSSTSHPLPPHPSALVPKANLQYARTTTSKTESQMVVEVDNVKATVNWQNMPIVSLHLAGQQKAIHADLDFRSYVVDGFGIAHYTRYKRNTLHVGLGEKAAPMNLSNRHFQIAVTDCFGYDIYRTDPLYKHIPLLINVTPQGCVGIFSTSHSRGEYAVGSEIDGLWGHFKVYRQDYGGLEEFIIVGETIEDVVRIYAGVVGYPLLVPRWAFGYIAGGYKYTMLDEPRSCDALMEFSSKLKEHDIPCSAFQMSSGYTFAETEPKIRNVFTWNSHRFPDPAKFVADYHKQGIRLIANVKPYVLDAHPDYHKLVASGAFFTDPRSNLPAVARLWSAGGGTGGYGGHIDFTSNFAFKWWLEGVKELRRLGIQGIWNDNNEFMINDDSWRCAADDYPDSGTTNQVGLWGRSLHTELMAKSSHDALVQVKPDERPYVLTRSATAGTMRYAATSWGGDNVTSWDSMKGANALSLNAGMSLIQCYGHDIGGFEGPQPSPELLLRWIQLGIHSPRFAINCFKTTENDNMIGEVIEPWMYPEITPLVRNAIKRRYELIPYLYSLALASHLFATPPQRWTGWGYESDPGVWKPEVLTGETQYWLGDTLLIGGVYRPGETTSRMYLPQGPGSEDGYINCNEPHQHFTSGQWINVDSEWKKSIPILARVGGGIAIGKNVQTRAPGDHDHPSFNVFEDDYRAIEIFPPPNAASKEYQYTWFEDDGIAAQPSILSLTLTYSSTKTQISVRLETREESAFCPVWKKVNIILPVGDARKVKNAITGEEYRWVKENRGRWEFEGPSMQL